MTTDKVDEATVPYADELRHIESVRAEIAHLATEQEQAEDRVIERAGRDYNAGRLDIEELFALYEWIRPRTVGKIRDRWNRHMPREAWSQCLRHTIERRDRHRPDPDGAWRGTYPLHPASRYPGSGVSVIYVLYDDADQACYVGSTERFGQRMDAHRRDGKRFVRWTAEACPDREVAYAIESRVLGHCQPYLNKKSSR